MFSWYIYLDSDWFIDDCIFHLRPIRIIFKNNTSDSKGHCDYVKGTIHQGIQLKILSSPLSSYVKASTITGEKNRKRIPSWNRTLRWRCWSSLIWYIKCTWGTLTYMEWVQYLLEPALLFPAICLSNLHSYFTLPLPYSMPSPNKDC